jgi:alkanesulfonate monooxygenase SsuD/methylene tetrahydromethanopterin reductase-like flavin-dependent oxidoreductase (luciferase family)
MRAPARRAALPGAAVHGARRVVQAALERAAALLGLYARPFREAAAKYCLLGRPEDCLDGIRRFVAAGVRHVILAPLGDPDELLDVAATSLLPGLRALAPSPASGA